MGRWRVAVAAGLLAAALPAMAWGVVYTFVATPLVMAVGDVTTFTFTFTNLDTSSRIGCTEVLFPDEFWINSTGSVVASSGEDWYTDRLGQWVRARSDDGGGTLRFGESVSFTVTALATTAGSYIFDYHVHKRNDCSGNNLYGTVTLPLTVLPGATPTPTPKATATPTPQPTGTTRPTPSPTPGTPRPAPTATPDGATPTQTPTPTATPRASASAEPALPFPSPGGSSGPQVIRVAPLGGGGGSGGQADNLGVGVDVLTLVASPFDWILPGAPVALPGLLVILFVALQAAGALAWIPAVRRLAEDDDDPRTRRRPRPVSRGA